MKDSKLKRTLLPLVIKLYKAKDLLELRTRYHLHIMSSKQTIQYIKRNKCSIARFGDGEFGIMLNSGNPDFQKYNDELSEGLKNLLKNKNNKLLICVPIFFNSTKGTTLFCRNYWKNWGTYDGRQKKIAWLFKKSCGGGITTAIPN